MLCHLVVEGFKSIRKLDLKLGPLNVMIGANGAGKSNLISLFQCINRIIDRKFQVYVPQSGGPDSLLHFGKKHTNRIYLKLDFGQNGYELSLIPTRENILVFTEEKCWFQGNDTAAPHFVDLGSGHKESNLPGEAQKIPDPIADHVLKKMKSWTIYHFHDTGESARMKGAGNINDNIRLNPDASNLAAFLYFLQETHYRHYQNIVDTVRLAAPFLDDFILRPNPLNKELIQLEWREKESDAYFNAHSLSDGTLRFICLAVLLMQPDLPSTILLDEPELGLHPYAISLLAGLLQSAAARTQVIVATQSVTLVNQFTHEDIIVVDRENKQSVFRHVDKKVIEKWMEEYSIGDLWEKNILGGRPAYE
jgi:predicted ATPase